MRLREKSVKHASRRLCRAVGFDHYLIKPCDPQEIVQSR
jgi:CheY-like chemotaxis protein